MRNMNFDKREFKKQVKENVKLLYRKNFEEANSQEVYQAVALAVKDDIIDNWLATQKVMEEKDPKIVYYMSMEFLMGRALGNNLINLCEYDEVKEALDELGFDIDAIEDQEPDPALGNGGLGRLAACFLDSLTTLGYSAYGCGIRYRYGMFKQKIEDGFQKEVPDNWLKDGYPFEMKRPEYSHEVHFGGYVRSEMGENGKINFIHEGYSSVIAVPYDMPIVGYGNDMVNTLMIWDAEPKEVFRLDSFDKGEYNKAVEEENLAKNLVEVLYPNDNHYAGKELRLKQQYFFISASVQLAIRPEYAPFVERLLQPVQKQPLSQAAMETLSVIAYRQPVTKAEIEAIRGVKCDYSVQSLSDKGLIREAGRKEALGRPILYATTEEFLRHFGIESLEELPKLKEFTAEEVMSEPLAGASEEEK